MTRTYNPSFCRNFDTNVGRLDANLPKRSGGKKLLDWSFQAKGAKDAIQVSVHLEQDDGIMRFTAHCDQLSAPLSDSDINRLYTNVQAQLIERSHSMSGIHWEDWLEVIVRGENSDFDDSRYSALGANLHIRINGLKRGIHPVSGKPVTININGVVVPFPEPTRLGDGNLENQGFRLQNAEERAYLPSSPETMLALREILARMGTLRDSLAELLSSHNIHQSLQSIKSAIPLLGIMAKDPSC